MTCTPYVLSYTRFVNHVKYCGGDGIFDDFIVIVWLHCSCQLLIVCIRTNIYRYICTCTPKKSFYKFILPSFTNQKQNSMIPSIRQQYYLLWHCLLLIMCFYYYFYLRRKLKPTIIQWTCNKKVNYEWKGIQIYYSIIRSS